MSATSLVRAHAPARFRFRPVVPGGRYISLLVLVLVWQGAASAGLVSPRVLASPVQILAAGWGLLVSGELPWHLAVSLGRVAAGLSIGLAAGAGLALWAGLSRVGEELVDAPVQALRTLPFLALVPLFILWLGIGEAPKVALVALGSAFPVYLNLYAGIRGGEPRLAEMGRVFGLSRAGLIRQVVLPGALPSALVGLRQSVSVAWLSLVVAEQINAQAGIGYLINDARDFLRTDVILVGLVLYALLGLGTDSLVRGAGAAVARLASGGGAVMDAHFDNFGGARVRNLTRQFGAGRPVLDRLNLDIRPGEFVALLGASGSGKTTLLRTLAALDPVPENAVVSLPQPVAAVFQQPLLLPWQNVWRNVALGLVDARAQAEAALAEVGLAHRVHAWPSTLSGGEAQRVALARALVREPGLLLLDEPFAALDALTRLRMHALVLQLWARHRPATLLVTHDVDEAVALADRLLVLDGGRIVLDVPNTAGRPRDRASAGFAGLRALLLERLGVGEMA